MFKHYFSFDIFFILVILSMPQVFEQSLFLFLLVMGNADDFFKILVSRSGPPGLFFSYHLSNRQKFKNFEGPISSFLSSRPQNCLLRIHSEMRNEILGLLGGQPFFYLLSFFLFLCTRCARSTVA